jgi:hypothetical protein
MKLVFDVHRTSRTYEGATCPTSSLDTIIRSTSICPTVFQVRVYHHDGERGEETCSP